MIRYTVVWVQSAQDDAKTRSPTARKAHPCFRKWENNSCRFSFWDARFVLWPPVRCESPNAMAPWFNDEKRSLQFSFTVQRQNAFKFGVKNALGRGRCAKVDDSRSTALNKDERAEVPVAGDQDTALFLSCAKQSRVLCLGPDRFHLLQPHHGPIRAGSGPWLHTRLGPLRISRRRRQTDFFRG